jgi:hypothetical protein
VCYTATIGDRPVCIGTITYVSVVPGEAASTPIPDRFRTALETGEAQP